MRAATDTSEFISKSTKLGLLSMNEAIPFVIIVAKINITNIKKFWLELKTWKQVTQYTGIEVNLLLMEKFPKLGQQVASRGT